MNNLTHRPYKLVGWCGKVGEVCAREIMAVDGIEEETGEGSVAMAGCPPQWLDRRGLLMGDSYSSSMVLLIQILAFIIQAFHKYLNSSKQISSSLTSPYRLCGQLLLSLCDCRSGPQRTPQQVWCHANQHHKRFHILNVMQIEGYSPFTFWHEIN